MLNKSSVPCSVQDETKLKVHDIKVYGIGGGNGSGRATLGKLVASLFEPPVVQFFDVKTAITWCLENPSQTKLGLVNQIKDQLPRVNEGGIFNAVISVHSVIAYINACISADTVIVSGFPETGAAITHWQASPNRCQLKVMNIAATTDQMARGIIARQKKIGQAENETVEALAKSWGIHFSGRKSLDEKLGTKVLPLQYARNLADLLKNVRSAIGFMDVAHDSKMDALAQTGGEPFVQEVRSIFADSLSQPHSAHTHVATTAITKPPAPTYAFMFKKPSTEASHRNFGLNE